MQQHAKPSLASEILIVQSMDLRKKKKKYKGKHSVNPSQTPEKLIVQSMELRGNRKKYKSKQNANFGEGDALNPAQYSGKKICCIDETFFATPSSNGCYNLGTSTRRQPVKIPARGD